MRKLLNRFLNYWNRHELDALRKAALIAYTRGDWEAFVRFDRQYEALKREE